MTEPHYVALQVPAGKIAAASAGHGK